MFKRKIYDSMSDWKNDEHKHSALVIKGLRQVGKTYIVTKFAKENYKNIVYIDFKSNPRIKRIFDDDLDVNTLVRSISASIPNVTFAPHNTVIVFDEIQECSNARSSIKQFVEDGRFDVICTGSLLGIRGYNEKRNRDVPVGFEHTLYMKSMDFEEFLWAKGISKEITDYLEDCCIEEKPVDDAVHRNMIRYFREYICVGGLPRVVKTYLETNDFNKVYKEQRNLLENYRDDFGKHLDEDENEYTDMSMLTYINSVYDSIPSQLSKENKKFQYSTIKKGGRGSQYLPAIQWLCEYGLTNRCFNLTSFHRPLEGYKEENTFKLFMQDSGLFVATLDRGSIPEILLGDLGIYKGAIYENIVADAFSKCGRNLYYYSRSGAMEIDFVTMFRGKVCLIEVKATTGNTKASKEILGNFDKYQVDQCIKLGEYNIGHEGSIITLPHYLAFMIDRLDNDYLDKITSRALET